MPFFISELILVLWKSILLFIQLANLLLYNISMQKVAFLSDDVHAYKCCMIYRYMIAEKNINNCLQAC